MILSRFSTNAGCTAFALMLFALAGASSRGAEIVNYDFDAAARAAGVPAANDLVSTSLPYYIVDGAHSGLPTGNPNLVFSSTVPDLSGNGRTLVHENQVNASPYQPANGSAYTRYVHSNASGGGTGAYGIYASDGNSTILETSQTLTNAEFTNTLDGFSILANVEIERSAAPGSTIVIAGVNNIYLALLSSGKIGATITGTFGSHPNGSPVTSSTTFIKSGGVRAAHLVRLSYNTKATPATGDDTLSLYVDGVLEDSQNVFVNTSLNNGHLNILGLGNGSLIGAGIMLQSLQIVQGAPEPSSFAVGAIGASIVFTRRRSLKRYSHSI